MGKTIRVSTSPYARPRARRRGSSLKTSQSKPKAIEKGKGMPSSETSVNTMDEQSIAKSVVEQIVPELKDFITQSIQAMDKSPRGQISTPDTDQENSYFRG